MDPDNPEQAILSHVTLGGALESKYVVDVAAGGRAYCHCCLAKKGQQTRQ